MEKVYEDMISEYWQLRALVSNMKIELDTVKDMRYELIMENEELRNEIRRLKGEPEVKGAGAVEYAHMLDIATNPLDHKADETTFATGGYSKASLFHEF